MSPSTGDYARGLAPVRHAHVARPTGRAIVWVPASPSRTVGGRTSQCYCPTCGGKKHAGVCTRGCAS